MQRVVLSFMAQYYNHTGEACTIRYLARKLDLHPETVRRHIHALHAKGLLGAPAVPSGRLPG